MGKPYIVPDSWTKTPSQALGTTYAINLPPDAEAGDYIGVWIVQDLGGATTIAESGGSAFTFLGTQATTGAIRTAYCFDPAATGGGSDVLTVDCNSAAIWAVSWLVRGHHASPHGSGGDTPAGPATGTDFVYATETAIGTDGLIAGAMTTRDANTLNMYLVGMDASGTAFRCAANEAVFPVVYWDAAISGGVGYNPATSTTAVQPTFYGAPSTEGIQILSIAIRWDGVTDCGQPYCESNLVELDWLSPISANNPAMNPTWGAIDSTTIDGLTTNTATVTLTYAALANPDTGISFENVANMTYGGAGTAIADPGAWVGKKLTFGSAKDLTNQILNLAWMTTHVSTIAHVGAKGIAIRLTDGTNWVAYTIEEKAAFVGSALKNVQIELGVATELDHSGTVASALSGCTEIEFLWHRTGNVTTTGYFNFSNLVAFDRDTPATIRGGGAASPASAIAYAEAMQSFNQFRLVGLQSEAQVMARGSLMIGDGTNDLYWDSLAGALAWPKSYNGTSQDFWRVADNKVGLYDNAISGNTVKLRAGSVVAPGQQIFTTGPSAHVGAVRDYGGQVFIGLSPTFLAGETYANMTLSRCGPVNTSGANLTNCSVLNTAATGTDGAVVVDANGSTLDSCPIDGTGAAYALELGTAVTDITLTDCPITTGSTAKIHVLATTGTVTITISGSTVSPTYVSEGAAVDISAPVNTADISITGMPDVDPGVDTAPTRLQIINTTAISAADWTANTPYTAGDVVLRTSGIGSENTAGLYMRCTTGGTSHVTTEPTWDTTVGNTTTDGTVVWTTYAILYYDADPAATSLTDTYIDGEEFKAGETIEIRFAEEDPAVSFKIYSTSVVAATTGFSALVNETDDSSYATYATSGVTQDSIFSPDFVNNYVVLDTDTNFTASGAYAYYCYLLTTSEGMYRFWGGLTGIDPGNIRNNASVVSLYFDCSSGFVRQTDDIRIFRSDGLRPALDPVSAAGGGIEVNWKVPVNVVTTGGSALTPTESAQLMALPSASTTATAVGSRTVEGSYSEDEILKLLAAALAGKREGIGTATETYTGLDGTTPRISLTPDANGNGTPVLDVT